MTQLLRKTILYLYLLLLGVSACQASVRTVITLGKGWKFTKGDPAEAMKPDFNDAGWASVTVPHGARQRDGIDGRDLGECIGSMQGVMMVPMAPASF